MAPSWHQNRTTLDLHNANMNLCDIELSSHLDTLQILFNQYFVAFDAGCTILSEFKDMMAHQSAMAAEGADEQEKYLELIWANLGCGLTMITGFCTAINPIHFTMWTSIVLVFGIMLGMLISWLCRCLASKMSPELYLTETFLMDADQCSIRWPTLQRKSPDKEE